MSMKENNISLRGMNRREHWSGMDDRKQNLDPGINYGHTKKKMKIKYKFAMSDSESPSAIIEEPKKKPKKKATKKITKGETKSKCHSSTRAYKLLDQ
ncbi:hypothetical protein DVH24_009671 [Malus domestica]|uniref:Uncharacterized protein n=1 Tax=Malus domestica TaxID=3750 RepID=A0A498JLL4_MALDO|nr:hypothetical protein DVH24_009671 [Malus domestica]